MAQWGQTWGSQWGCGAQQGFESLADICERFLWWQFRDSKNIKALCALLTERFSVIDQKLQETIARRGLEGARGGELDNWGEIVGRSRHGASDTLYRRAIKARARTALSSANIGDFFAIATLISPDSDPTFAEVYPLCVRMFFSSAIDNDEKALIFELMRDVPGLTVCLQFVEVDPNGVFEFSYNNASGPDDSVDFHWSHTDGDVVNTAGFAYLVEI